MGKHFSLAMRLPLYHKEQRSKRNRLSVRKRSGGHNSGMVVFGALIIFIGLYLFQVNSFSTKGYEVRSLQKKVAQLGEQQKQLATKAAELQSLQRLGSDSALGRMVPVTTISYIQNANLTKR